MDLLWMLRQVYGLVFMLRDVALYTTAAIPIAHHLPMSDIVAYADVCNRNTIRL